MIQAEEPRHDTQDALNALAERLGLATDLTTDSESLLRAVEQVVAQHGSTTSASWPASLETLARHMGLVVRWRVAERADIEDEVQPGLPALTWTPDGWEVYEQARGRVVWRRVPGGTSARRLSSAPRRADPVAWALVEPALPAAVLGDPAHQASPLRRLGHLLHAERRDLSTVLIYAVASALLGLAVPVAVQVLVNTVAFGAFRQPVLALGFLLLLALGVAAVLRVLQRIVVEMLQRRLFVRMTADLAARLPRARSDAFGNSAGPELVNRFFDVITLQKSLGSLLLEGLGAALQGAVGLVLLALYHPALLAFDLLLVTTIVLILWLGFRRATTTAILESKRKYEVAGWLEEIAARPDLTKLGGGPDLALARADRLARGWLEARESHFAAAVTQIGAVLALQALANTALLAIGGWLVIENQLTLGQLVAAELVVSSVLLSVAKFAEKLEVAYDLLAAVDKLGYLVDLPLERADGALPQGEGPAGLELDGVSLSTAGSPALVEASLTLEPGQCGVVVGPEGRSRSAIADVTLWLRAPAAGAVHLDGTDLRSLRLDALRKRVTLVRRADVITGTLAENVTFGRLDLPLSQVDAVVDAVGLRPALARMPQGIQTPLTPTGHPLDTADTVRLACARALVAKPGLIVVDGLLDRVEPDEAARLFQVLRSHADGASVLLLTRDTRLAAHADVAWQLVRQTLEPLALPAGAPR